MMMKKMLKRMILLAVMAAGSVCGFAQQTSTEKINIGDPMPAIQLSSTTYGNV